ncbi:MAG: hypothetical protein QXN87_07000 [Candidatus Bathyarchaeia archaeon]
MSKLMLSTKYKTEGILRRDSSNCMSKDNFNVNKIGKKAFCNTYFDQLMRVEA